MKKVIAFVLTVCLGFALAACGENVPAQPTTQPSEQPAAELQMPAVYEIMQQSAQLPEMIMMDETLMLDYCGIQAADVKQAVVVICADSLRTDEIWLLEATDSAALARLQTLAEKRLQAKGEESITYSPEQYAVVEKAQTIVTGNYLALIVSPDVDTLAAAFRAEAGI